MRNEFPTGAELAAQDDPNAVDWIACSPSEYGIWEACLEKVKQASSALVLFLVWAVLEGPYVMSEGKVGR